MLPTAALWGVRHAHVDDYLGPHRTTYQVTYSGEIALDLGPLGHAYLDDRFVPKSLQFVGLDIKIEGVRGTQGASTDILSASTLEAYLQVYAEPRGVLHGPLEKLVTSAIIQTAIAEGVLLVVCALWLLRRRWLSPGLARALRPRWVVSGYLILVLIILGSVLPAERPGDDRISVSITDNTPFAGMQVDNRLLAVLLNRGISGLRVLADRQQAAIDAYVQTAEASFTEQLGKVAPAATNETMTLGYSDLHCSLAMTAVIAKVVTQVQPALLISSGDDTMNGTAAERPCLVRERAMAGDRPTVIATGNHDSETTDAQMRSLGFTVLDGKVVSAGGARFLGDDDPEYNLPFSIARTMERKETVPQLGQRMRDVAGSAGGVDVLLVHQPRAAEVIRNVPEPPTRLLLWGHMHHQDGPYVINHADGSWTVALQAGTAGGVKQPTLTDFSTPYTPPRTVAEIYLFFTDTATGLITGVRPIHFQTDGTAVIDDRINTGNLATLPAPTRDRLIDARPQAPAAATPVSPSASAATG